LKRKRKKYKRLRQFLTHYRPARPFFWETENFILEDLLSSVLSQFKKNITLLKTWNLEI